MSTIKSQTIKNTIIDYFGIGLGFLNMSILFPNMLSKEELGLRGIIITLATIAANFSTLGSTSLLLRFFPFFKSKDKKHQGFLSLILTIGLVGFFILCVLSYVFQPLIFSSYADKSPLIVDYFWFVILASFGLLYCNILNNYFFILLKTVVSSFFLHIGLRFIWLIQVLLYFYEVIDFNGFIWLLTFSYFIQLFGLIIYGIYLKQIKLSFTLPKISRKLKKVMINYSLFAIATGYIGMIVSSIDQLMIASLLGTAPIAVYSIAYYLSNVITVPGRSLTVIASPVISYQIKRKDFKPLNSIYKKSCVNMGVSAGFVFLIIWVNISSYIQILPEGYSDIKYVMLFLGLGRFFDSLTGTNAQIIGLSKYYRFNLYSGVLLIGITASLNWILIPSHGLIGAAFATGITLLLFNTMRTLFVKYKMNMWPYTLKSILKMLTCIIPPFLFSFFIKISSGNIYIDVFANTSLYSLIFGTLLILLKPSDEIHEIIVKHWNRYIPYKLE